MLCGAGMMHIHMPLTLFSHTWHSFLQPPTLTRSNHCASVSSSHEFLPSYLVDKCGFTQEKAVRASKQLPRVKSPNQPDSVIAFFHSLGFKDAQVRKLLKTNHRLLARNVEKSIAPKVCVLNEIGITGVSLVNLIISNPRILDHKIEPDSTTVPELCRSMGSDKLLMECLIEKWVGNNIESLVKSVTFLRECGLSDHQIRFILDKRTQIIRQKPEYLSELVSRVESLRMPRGSPTFHWGLFALSMVSDEKLNAKTEMLKGFGWSEDEIFVAFRNSPMIMCYSLESTKKKMEFLVKEAGCPASYIALYPVLLNLSLEKRLIPRIRVLKALKKKGLSGSNHKVSTFMTLTNDKFVERYVTPNMESIPELSQLFDSTSSDKPEVISF